jgi:hypothetical protein
MKKSTRALVGLVVLDALLLLGALWLVLKVRSGDWSTSVPPSEAIKTITSTAGGAIGFVTAILLLAFVFHRRKGN